MTNIEILAFIITPIIGVAIGCSVAYWKWYAAE
jgi:hypothetical protein